MSLRDKTYLQRQSFRRLQIHILLGVTGILMLCGIYIPVREYVQAWTIIWLAIIILLCWAMLLALVDYISIRLHFGRSEMENRIEKIRLDYEIRKFDQEQDRKSARQNDSNDPKNDSGDK